MVRDSKATSLFTEKSTIIPSQVQKQVRSGEDVFLRDVERKPKTSVSIRKASAVSDGLITA